MDPIGTNIALGAAGAGGDNYFIDRIIYGTGTDYVTIEGTYVDSDGNIYDAGYVQSVTPYPAFIMKRNAEGVIQWSRTLTDSTANLEFRNMASDGTYLYCVGWGHNGTKALAIVAVYDLSGTLQWQKLYDPAGGTTAVYGEEIALDSSGNIFIFAREISSPNLQNLVIIKLNNSGVSQWALGIGGLVANTYNFLVSMCVDSSDNVLASARLNSASGINTGGALVKVNNSGTLQWDAFLTPGTGIHTAGRVDTDSNDNVYWALTYSSSRYLLKYNSSGVLQTNVKFTSYPDPYVDDDDNLWHTGQTYIEKSDTSLTKDFSRTASKLYYAQLYRAPGSDGIYAAVRHSNSSYTGWNAFLPIDGSLTGNYTHPTFGTFDYVSVTAANSAGTTFNDVGSVSTASKTVTTTTATHTDASATFTNEPYFL